MKMGQKKKAVVLLSGGVDSSTVAAIAKSKGYSLHALTVDYGQRHRAELQAARRICRFLGIREQRVLSIDLRQFGGSALTSSLRVPKFDAARSGGRSIPVTYVPARNTIFLSLALAYAETIRAFDLFIGANAVDYSGYPDCRPEFLRAFERMANLATQVGVEKRGRFRVHAPLLRMSKAQILRAGLRLGLDYSLTHSCYDPGAKGRACKRCDSCRIRQKGFAEIEKSDPIL